MDVDAKQKMADEAYDDALPADADADAAGEEPEPPRWPEPVMNACAESWGTQKDPAHTAPRLYKEGDEVDVFYRALEEDTGNYFPCLDATDNLCGPRLARTDGWVPAVVERPHHGWDGELVVCRHAWAHWREPAGRPLDMDDDRNSIGRFSQNRVRMREAAPKPPALDLLLVRWGGKEDPDACAGQYSGSWGSAGAVVSDRFASGLLDFFHWKLGTDYGAVTAFVTSGADLERLCAHRIKQRLSGKHIAAFYLLWPARFDDGAAGRPGMMPSDSLLELMRRVEGVGVPTRFPHSAHVYRALLAKEWTTAVCGAGPTALRVPATTRVACAAVARDAKRAAKRAVSALTAIKGTVDEEEPRGVVKLGYSWEALDVRAWRGLEDLAGALQEVLHQPGCRARYVFVQECVQHAGEARCYVVDGRIDKILFTRFEPPDDEGDDAGRFCTFKEVPRAQVQQDWCRGDAGRLADLEKQLRDLCSAWRTWLLALDCEPQPFVRIDAFVRWDDERGAWRLTTGELTELGGSFLGWRDGPRNVFGAVLRSCFRDGLLEAWEKHRLAPPDDETPDRPSTPREDEDDARPGWGDEPPAPPETGLEVHYGPG